MNAKKAKALRKKLKFNPNAERPIEGAVYKNGQITIINERKGLRAMYQAMKKAGI
jgi:hypothetical protein